MFSGLVVAPQRSSGIIDVAEGVALEFFHSSSLSDIFPLIITLYLQSTSCPDPSAVFQLDFGIEGLDLLTSKSFRGVPDTFLK